MMMKIVLFTLVHNKKYLIVNTDTRQSVWRCSLPCSGICYSCVGHWSKCDILSLGYGVKFLFESEE